LLAGWLTDSGFSYDAKEMVRKAAEFVRTVDTGAVVDAALLSAMSGLRQRMHRLVPFRERHRFSDGITFTDRLESHDFLLIIFEIIGQNL
jgi:hypothetical protein